MGVCCHPYLAHTVLPLHSSQHHSLTTPVTLVTYHIHLVTTPSHLSLWLPNPTHTRTLILMRSVKQQDSQLTRSSVLRSASTCSTLRRWNFSPQMTLERSWEPWVSVPLRRNSRISLRRSTWMVLERSKSENSVNYVLHSWWRILIWRP